MEKFEEQLQQSMREAQVPITEFDTAFAHRMVCAMMISYFKYGKVADAYPLKFSAIDDIRKRLQEYRRTGNKHFLVDIANFAMIEAMHPGQESEWGQNDARSSPGRVTADGHRLVHEMNDGTRILEQEK